MSPTVVDVVKAIFPTPDPNSSEEQADRFTNRDLPAESVDSLRRELTVLHVVNFVLDSEWHRDRETAVANELGYRRTRRRLERHT